MNEQAETELKSRRFRGKMVQAPLSGLIALSVCLLIASSLITYGLIRVSRNERSPNSFTGAALEATQAHSSSNSKEVPAWGELISSDIDLEQPEEYAAFEVHDKPEAVWNFAGQTSDQVRNAMLQCGLSSFQTEHALNPQFSSSSPVGTIVRPDDDLAFSISPPVRAKLYAQLARYSPNTNMRFPWTFPGHTFEERFATNAVEPSTHDLMKKLLYPIGGLECFSDYEVALRQISAERERFRFIVALSRQSAVLPRLRITKHTDVDKLLGYWGHGAREKDLRPLVEAVQRLESGGSISLLYFLPPFVRERLYTFPVPSKPGEPGLDCHWSTLNFFNSTPDNRFADPTYTFSFIVTNCYQVAKPTMYGDIVLYVDENARWCIRGFTSPTILCLRRTGTVLFNRGRSCV